jgi:hypothetical protein
MIGEKCMKKPWMVALCALLSGCASPILLDNPNSSDYAHLSVVIGDGENGVPLYLPAVGIVQVMQIDGSHRSHFDPSYISSLYLKSGSYQITANCRRSVDLSLGYGPNETFMINIQASKHYSLDCTPGTEKPDFKLTEIPS